MAFEMNGKWYGAESEMNRIFEPPRAAGCWIIGGNTGLHIYVGSRPRWLVRVLCRWLLEWEWRDA